MISWEVSYTNSAELDLRDIFEYIAYALCEPVTAKKMVKHIMSSTAKLSIMPFRFKLYEKEPWFSKGLRVLPVENYLVFYLPVESRKAIIIIRIMYGGRDIDTLLGETKTETI